MVLNYQLIFIIWIQFQDLVRKILLIYQLKFYFAIVQLSLDQILKLTSIIDRKDYGGRMVLVMEFKLYMLLFICKIPVKNIDKQNLYLIKVIKINAFIFLFLFKSHY
jgi:hypothetical protein